MYLCTMDRKKKNIIELTRIGLDEYKQERKLAVKIIVDSVRSMNNIGSLFRTADAFLIDEIVLCGISAYPPNPDIHKTALGAEESVDWSYHNNIVSVVEELKQQGYVICALEQTHNSTELQNFIPQKDQKYAIIVGNEVDGVNQKVIDLTDQVLEIPQCGIKHSLNVAVSAGIAMWHFFSNLQNNKSN